MFPVTGEAQSRCDNELRWTASAGAFDCGADDFEALRQVGAIDRAAFVPVAFRAIDQIAYIRFASVYQSFEDLEALKREVDSLYEERGTPGAFDA